MGWLRPPSARQDKIDFGKRKLTAIGPREVEDFKQARIADGVKPISVNNELAVLQAVLSYARHLRIPLPQFVLKRLPVRHKSRLLVWSEEDVRALLASCMTRSKHIVPLVVFLANTGARRGEALALLWADVDLEERMIRITPSEEWQPKNGRAREIPISDELHSVLFALTRKSEYVFTTADGHGYASWPKRQFDRARKAAGLHGGPHTLRHTFASHFLKQVPDLFLLARVLGHSDARVTKLYAHLLPEHLARARNAVRFAAPVATTSARQRAASKWSMPVDAVSVSDKPQRSVAKIRNPKQRGR